MLHNLFKIVENDQASEVLNTPNHKQGNIIASTSNSAIVSFYYILIYQYKVMGSVGDFVKYAASLFSVILIRFSGC